MGSVVEQSLLVLSGPIESRGRMMDALRSIGLAVASEDDHQALGSVGLPSYRDPIAAHDAGKPNSGHHVHEPHPATLDYLVVKGDHKGCTLNEKGNAITCEHLGDVETRAHECEHVGEPYEDDPGIGWVIAFGTAINSAADAAEGIGWTLRMHTQPSIWQPMTPETIEFPEVQR